MIRQPSRSRASAVGGDLRVGRVDIKEAAGVIEFPKRPAADDVVSERIIFAVGDTRFAINWTAEIERLPPAGPVAVERKQPLNSNRSSEVRR
jgi:hypothetical protein